MNFGIICKDVYKTFETCSSLFVLQVVQESHPLPALAVIVSGYPLNSFYMQIYVAFTYYVTMQSNLKKSRSPPAFSAPSLGLDCCQKLSILQNDQQHFDAVKSSQLRLAPSTIHLGSLSPAAKRDIIDNL